MQDKNGSLDETEMQHLIFDLGVGTDKATHDVINGLVRQVLALCGYFEHSSSMF